MKLLMTGASAVVYTISFCVVANSLPAWAEVMKLVILKIIY